MTERDIRVVDFGSVFLVYDCTGYFDEVIARISYDDTGMRLSKEKALEIANLIKKEVKE